MAALDADNAAGSKRERAPRRAAARRCAYHTEQKSLERTFDQIDPTVIAEVLASHAGNMDLAAMEPGEYDQEAAAARLGLNTCGPSYSTQGAVDNLSMAHSYRHRPPPTKQTG